MTTRRSALAAAVAGLLLGTAMPTTPAHADDFRIAGVLPGSITDQAFNQSVYEGLVRARDALGVEMAFSEKVAQADQVEALSDYARRGYDLVFAAGGEFTASAGRVARRFPEAHLVVINGAPTDGVATIGYDNAQFGYILGFIAGHMSETGKAALITGQEIGAFKEIVDGYTRGMTAVNGDAEVLTTFTNDWDDVAKAKEAAFSQIDQGVDVVMPYLDNGIVGVVQAAEERGVWAQGIITDLGTSSPDANLASTTLDFGAGLVEAVKLAQAGALGKGDHRLPFGTDAGGFGTLNPAIPEDVVAAAKDIAEAMRSGTFTMPQ